METWNEQTRSRLDEALRFAAEAHRGQCRKGSQRPYILHPMEVAAFLNRMEADPELILAGLLHDTLEDTAATREQLETRFGSGVTALVSAHSEDKSKSWQERKDAAILEAEEGDRRLKMLILADKLSNLTSIERDRRNLGEAVWDRFNAPKARQRWYYAAMTEALRPLAADPVCAPLWQELETSFHRTFD